jgi:hypothetical protein
MRGKIFFSSGIQSGYCTAFGCHVPMVSVCDCFLVFFVFHDVDSLEQY